MPVFSFFGFPYVTILYNYFLSIYPLSLPFLPSLSLSVIVCPQLSCHLHSTLPLILNPLLISHLPQPVEEMNKTAHHQELWVTFSPNSFAKLCKMKEYQQQWSRKVEYQNVRFLSHLVISCSRLGTRVNLITIVKNSLFQNWAHEPKIIILLYWK